MLRSFLTRPFVQRLLGHPQVGEANLGPVVVYGALAVLSAWAGWHAGWPPAGGFWGAWLAGFFGTIVCNELRYCATGVHTVYRR